MDKDKTTLGERMRSMTPTELCDLIAGIPDLYAQVVSLKDSLAKCFEALDMWREIDQAGARAFGRYYEPDWLSWKKAVTRDNVLEDFKSLDDFDSLADRVMVLKDQAVDRLLRIGGMKMPKERIPVLDEGGVATFDGRPIMFETAEGNFDRQLQEDLRGLGCRTDPRQYSRIDRDSRVGVSFYEAVDSLKRKGGDGHGCHA